MSETNNGWNEWSRHVLKELERLNATYQQLSSDVAEVKAKVTNYSPEKITKLEMQMQNMQNSDGDQETRLRAIETSLALSTANASKVGDLETKVAKLEEKTTEIEKREAKFSGKWAILAVIGAAFVSATVGFMFKIFSEPTSEPKRKGRSHVIEKHLTAPELAALRTP